MTIIGIIDEDFVNYKKPSMVIEFPYCDFKCDKECGRQVCQNSTLASAKPIDIGCTNIINRYLKNNITQALVLQGLEPLDSWSDVKELLQRFREKSNDDIVIYTGYKEEECMDKIDVFRKYDAIVKFGRFVPGQKKHFDDILGVYLASNNQYGKRM